MKILVVDDQEKMRKLIIEYLKLEGYDYDQAKDGREALDLFKNKTYDAVLLDVMMPKLDGYGALSALKSDPKTKDIPVVMLSALIQDLNMKKASDLGADEYLVKSETMPGQVVAQIEKFLKK